MTFHDAFILAPDPEYAPPIPGSQWISGRPVFVGPELILYRRTFTLPTPLTNPTFAIEVHADNVATIFLNGTQIGQQPFEDIPENFQGPPETFTAPPGVLRPGTNALAIDVFNFGILTGLDYKATITVEACTLEALLDHVEALVAAGKLSRAQGHALSVKLAAALRQLERGKTKAAGNIIGAFLNQVEALVRSRRLSDADAGPLRDQAACVRTQLHG
jgi:hypothetical protein